MDIKGQTGRMLLAFFLFGMIFIAANFYLMALGIWADSPKLW